MLVNQKNQYALRAIFELARHKGKGPVKVQNISKAQAIPLRFLEVILGRLKRNGLVKSKRGYTGGYTLIKNPENITVGDVFRYMDESIHPVECVTIDADESTCPLRGQCSFFPMWEKVHDAIYSVFDETTIQNLIDSETTKENHCCL
jgi:Rrf2 family protein